MMSVTSRVIVQSPMRRKIGKRMLESKLTAPHFYAQAEIVVDPLIEYLGDLNEHVESRITFTAALAVACVRTLEAHRQFNCVWTADGPTVVDDIHLGIAVSVDDGLLAPALLRAQQHNLVSAAAALGDLVARTRSAKLRPAEIADGTFTLSNLGMFDVSAFTAIITPPQVATLATGRPQRRLALVDEQAVETSVLIVTLSADHRVVDGTDSARWLGTFKALLEDPRALGRGGGHDGATTSDEGGQE